MIQDDGGFGMVGGQLSGLGQLCREYLQVEREARTGKASEVMQPGWVGDDVRSVGVAVRGIRVPVQNVADPANRGVPAKFFDVGRGPCRCQSYLGDLDAGQPTSMMQFID